MSNNSNTEWLAIFTYNGEEIMSSVPSLEIITYGSTYDETYNNTRKIIRNTIDNLLKQGKEIPSTYDLSYDRGPNQELILISSAK